MDVLVTKFGVGGGADTYAVVVSLSPLSVMMSNASPAKMPSEKIFPPAK